MDVNEQVYRDILGICLTDNSKLPYITTKVSVDDFPRGSYSTIYKVIVELYKLGVDVDIVTVSNRLLNTKKLKEIGGRETINDLALNSPLSVFTNKLVDQLNEQTTFRTVATLLDEFKTTLSTSTDTVSTCIDYCNKINNAVSGSVETDEISTISDGVDEVIEDLYKSKSKGCIGLDCGYPSLNYYLKKIKNHWK